MNVTIMYNIFNRMLVKACVTNYDFLSSQCNMISSNTTFYYYIETFLLEMYFLILPNKYIIYFQTL